MAIFIVDLPLKMVIFHSYVSLPEAMMNEYEPYPSKKHEEILHFE